MKKLAIICPGIGYHTDKPLLYYSKRIAAENGYDVVDIPYSGFPEKVKGDRKKMEKCYKIALNQTRGVLDDIKLDEYGEILFIGKSIGTAVATALAEKYEIQTKVRFVLYTPLEESFKPPVKNAIVFTGSADPWAGAPENRIPALCLERNITCYSISGANHSLETGDPMTDLRNLVQIMENTARFVSEAIY